MTPTMRRGIQAAFVAGALAWPHGLWAQTAAPAATAKSEAAKAKGPGNKAAAKKKAAAKPKLDPTAAQGEVEAGVTALGQGRNDAAVTSLSSALSAGSLPPTQSARALYYRGVAYRRQSKPAQAIADLTNALWIKNGLTEEQRADALVQRSASYRDAGLPEQGAPAPGGAASAQAGSKAKAGASTTMFSSVAPQPSTPATSTGGGGVFSSLFGGSSSPAQPQAAVAIAPVSTGTVSRGGGMPLPASGFESVVGGDAPVFYQGPSRGSARQATLPPPTQPTAAAKPWDTATEVKPAKSKASRQPAAKAKSPTAAQPAGGAVRMQVAAVRSPQEARGVAMQLQSGYARELAGRAPVVDQVAAGSLGTLYRVHVGPFASASEAGPLCTKLKGNGLDCRVLSP